MITNKKTKAFYFIIFLLPALLLYGLFFIFPLFQGIKYSFTDWNGIVPEIPFNIAKNEFENNILAKINNPHKSEYLLKFYELDEPSSFYRLSTWVQEDKGEPRKLTNKERKEIKKILKSVGITSINYIGLDNFKEMFKDKRFVPRFERRYLYNEFDELPTVLGKRSFKKKLLKNITDENEREFLLSKYHFVKSKSAYILDGELTEEETTRMKSILGDNMYEKVFVRGVIGFTLFFTLYNVLLTNLLALTLALILDTKMKYKNLLRSMFFLPNVISLIIVAYLWSYMFRLIFPLITGISVWLGSPDLAPYSVVMVAIWQGCGYLMVIYLAGLQTIPTELVEASEVDGAKWYQRLFFIKFPLLLPAFTICLFYSLSNSLRTFDIIMALTQGGPGYVTTPIVVDIYKNAFMQNRYGYATAKAVLLCLMIMVITGTQLYLMKRREVEL
jgi:raffinose/stachyose/melibiose transport system permease protein